MGPLNLIAAGLSVFLLPGVVLAQKSSVRHWAYVEPVRPELPEVERAQWPKNEIDYFVLARLEKEGLPPSPPAARARLLRRVYLDLIGLPPEIDVVDAFLKDSNSDAFEQVVDRLLSSSRYGEHWARHWLDLARYADSNGFQADQLRDSWAFRDWVIDAFNQDMPYDQFTIEQLAGDLLPDASLHQKIATGFHRAPTCNVEAGVDPEENRVHQVVDRVNVTATVWLGATMECAQCHDHKYDPFTQEEYYRLFAFFNNTPLEVRNLNGAGVTFEFYGPTMDLPFSPEQKAAREALSRKCDELESLIVRDFPKNDPASFETTQMVKELKKQIEGFKASTTLVMVEMEEPRESRILRRGDYLSLGKTVTYGTPEALHPWKPEYPENRLGLARWIVDPANPLTARVAVNRWWARFFGHGIVATEEDLGSQSEPPTHPELLDWLATEFATGGWSMKRVHKLIVMSSTYQQSSHVRSPGVMEADPLNKLYARGPRLRMSAEMIRDNALKISGLLSTKMGGAPVYPPQPPGVWKQLGRNEPKYILSTGKERFRRGIYVVYRRVAPYPSFVNFDAPDRASCHPKRSRTNTPIQALTLMNDEAYVEMSLALAYRILTSLPDGAVVDKVKHAFRLTLARRPHTGEIRTLSALFEHEVERFQENPEAARALVKGVKGYTPPQSTDPVELAAWFFVANVLLNLDETITKG